MEFDFSNYFNAAEVCVKPIDAGPPYTSELSELGYYKHCTIPSTNPDRQLEHDFFKGKDRIYFYDVKLCHSTRLPMYERFLEEYSRRGHNEDCAIHISNTLVPNKESLLTSLYDLPDFVELIEKVISINSRMILEVSNKRTEPTPVSEMKKIDEICKNILQPKGNVKHFMFREEIYDKEISPNKDSSTGVDIFFNDNYENLLRETIRYCDCLVKPNK